MFQSTTPDFYYCPHIRDWVCSQAAYEWLMEFAPGDVHAFARGRSGGVALHVVQIVGALDPVDRAASIIDRHPTYEILQFPAFYRKFEPEVARRIFRVPGGYTMIFMGGDLVDELGRAGLTGVQFASVDWTDGR